MNEMKTEKFGENSLARFSNVTKVNSKENPCGKWV